MGNFGTAAKMASSPSPRPFPDVDPIAHLLRGAWDTVARLRFVPLSYFDTTRDLHMDRGVVRLLYFQSFIEDDEES